MGAMVPDRYDSDLPGAMKAPDDKGDTPEWEPRPLLRTDRLVEGVDVGVVFPHLADVPAPCRRATPLHCRSTTATSCTSRSEDR